jgi:hypothetical protein
MRLPPRDDARWRLLVTGTHDYALRNLAGQLVISRVRLMAWRRDEAAIEMAITVVYDFFKKNAAQPQTQEDLQTIFG